MSKDATEMTTTGNTPEQLAAQLAALGTEIRSTLDARQRLHLDQLEYRIQEQRERFTLGMLEMGRCLNEVKQAKLVGHGHWEEWVALHTGATVRGAQRMMKAAREVPKTSTLTLLDYSKISVLLAVDPEEREEFAISVDAAHKSVRQLDAAVREKLAAEKKLRETEAALASANALKDKAVEAANAASARAQELEQSLAKAAQAPAQIIEREVPPADYAVLKSRDGAAAARIREAEDYADEQEQRVKELQAKLDAVNGQGSQVNDAQAFIAACSTFYGDICRYQNMTDVELMRGKSQADVSSMMTWVRMINSWASTMEALLNHPVTAEVEGYVR